MKERARLLLVAVATGTVVLAGGCTQSDEKRRPGLSSPRKESLQPVSLPGLARVSEPVRQRLREAHSALQAKTDDSGTPTSDLANAYGELGKLLMAADYLDAAEPCYLNAQALAPDDARWPYYLAHVYRSKNDFVKAAALFERTVQKQPNDLAALVYLGDTLLAQGRLEAAEPPLRKALSLEPRLAVALFALGRVALAKQDYGAAVQHLEQALRLDPQASVIHYPLAMAYRGLREAGKAEAHVKQRGDARVSFLPDPLMQELVASLPSPETYELRGTEALGNSEWAAAAIYLRKAVELAPDDPSVRLKLAEALKRGGQPEESLLHYEHAVKISPRALAAEARFGHAMALVRLRRYQDARDRLTEGMKVHADEPGFAQALVRLLAAAPDARVRDGRRALAITRDLLTRKPTPDLYETMAMALAESGQFEEAAALQRELIAAAKRAGRDDLALGMAENLKRYEAREPCRTPWRDNEMP